MGTGAKTCAGFSQSVDSLGQMFGPKTSPTRYVYVYQIDLYCNPVFQEKKNKKKQQQSSKTSSVHFS